MADASASSYFMSLFPYHPHHIYTPGFYFHFFLFLFKLFISICIFIFCYDTKKQKMSNTREIVWKIPSSDLSQS